MPQVRCCVLNAVQFFIFSPNVKRNGMLGGDHKVFSDTQSSSFTPSFRGHHSNSSSSSSTSSTPILCILFSHIKLHPYTVSVLDFRIHGTLKTVFVIGGKFLTIYFVFGFYIDLLYIFIETFSSKLRFL